MQKHTTFRLLLLVLLVLVAIGTSAAVMTRSEQRIIAADASAASMAATAAPTLHNGAAESTAAPRAHDQLSMVLVGSALIGIGTVLRKAA